MPITTRPRATRNRHGAQRWTQELADFLRFCETERRLAPMTCSAHLDSTQRYTRVNAHELRGAIKRLRWVG
jgi:hypothetical protein